MSQRRVAIPGLAAFILFCVIFFGIDSEVFIRTASGFNIIEFIVGRAPYFRESTLHNVDSLVGLEGVNGHVACIGDFNSDKYQDLFVVSPDLSSIDVYLWSHDDYEFQQLSSAHISTSRINNVVAGDFNYDGMLDVLISRSNEDNSQQFLIYTGDNKQFTPYINQTEEALDQVLVLDADGNMQLDLFGTSSSSGQRSFWLNDGHGQFIIEKQGGSSLAPLAQGASSSFVDINGDCLADLVAISCPEEVKAVNPGCYGNRTFEFWLNQKGSFALDSQISAPWAGRPSFADFDRDGAMDFVYPVCSPYPSCANVNSLVIRFNQQKRVCSSFFDRSDCLKIDNLCQASPYNFDQQVTVDLGAQTIFAYDNGLTTIPPMVRVGDYDLDGYPDLLIVMQIDSDSDATTQAQIWLNVPDPATGLRTFRQATGSQLNALTQIANPIAAFFFDLDESGMPHMMVLAEDPSTKNKTIHAIFNNVIRDAYMLKTLVTNGVCPEKCSTAPKNPSPKPYGANMPGVSIKYTLADLHGDQIAAAGSQLTQSSYMALQTPYNLFGLGRTNSFVDDLFVGIPNKDGDSNGFVAIIPNSQVVVLPYPPASPSSWTMELFVSPSRTTIWVAVAVVGTLIVLAIPIIIFKRKEKIEDEREKQQTAHLFSFDAL